MTRKKICQLITKLYGKYEFLLDLGILGENDTRYFKRVSEDMDDSDASLSLYQLADFLGRYYGKKVIILLDEYDTPMQEAYVKGYWDELVSFTRNLFNSTFKTNPYLERGIMTGILSYNAFVNCFNIESVKMGANVEKIGSYAFAGCFTTVELPDTLTEIGEGAFSGVKLTELNLPESLNIMGGVC